MSSLNNGNALLASALSGLSNTYSILAQNSTNKNGLTIEEIYIPEGINQLDETVFTDCRNVKEIHIQSTTLHFQELHFSRKNTTI